jgi:Fe-S cluster assembly protein SufD
MSDATLIQPGPAWLSALRDQGAARFAETGLPTQRDESWKYTNLARLKDFGLEPEPVAPPGFSEPAREVGFGPSAQPPAHRLVFVNGRFDAARSSIGSLPDGVLLGGLAALLEREPERVRPYLGRLAGGSRRALAALNTAWIDDGLALIVPENVTLAGMVEVVFAVGDDRRRTAHPRNVIHLGAGADARLLEIHAGGADGGLVNLVSEISLGANAALRHYVLHKETPAVFAVESVSAALERDARYRGFGLTLGGALVRRDIEVALAGRFGPYRRRLSGRRRAARRYHHIGRSRRAPLPVAPDAERHRRWARSRGLPGPDSRPSRRAENRRQPAQPDAVAVARSRDRREAGA